MRADRRLPGSTGTAAVVASALVSAAMLAGAPAPVHAAGPTWTGVNGAPAVTAGGTTAVTLQAPASPAEVRRATDEVLSRRAYATAEPSWWQRWLAEARAWVASRFLRLLEATSSTAVGWAVLGLATLVAVVVAWRLARGTRWEPARPIAGVDLERRSAREWDARSREAEGRGDLREAVRCAYRAVVASHAEAGLLDEATGRTVGELRRDVAAADPGGRAAFDRASDVVEAILYADRVPGGEDLATVRAGTRATAGAGR